MDLKGLLDFMGVVKSVVDRWCSCLSPYPNFQESRVWCGNTHHIFCGTFVHFKQEIIHLLKNHTTQIIAFIFIVFLRNEK